ncbi:MAG: HigA family addiction module antidote protein [Magnetococcales bacterium]|nr:HigA family addiction module antidote protein [Magnetococcales bacterium]
MNDPVSPGEIIRDLCLKPLHLSVTQAAEGLGVTRKTLSLLLNGHSGISPEMAVRLSRAFGRSPESWLQLQAQFDLAKLDQERIQCSIKPLFTHQNMHI